MTVGHCDHQCSDDEVINDDVALLKTSSSSVDHHLHVSPVRWYLLVIVTAICGVQGGIWSNFGPVSSSVEPLYHWGDGSIALLANWGPIAYITAFIPFAWALDVWGLRPATLVAAALITTGAALRCVVTTPGTWAPLLMHAGQILNGLAGPYAMSAGPVLSTQWFPPHERTTATAIASSMNYAGTALTFVIGPALLPDYGSSGSSDSSQVVLSPAEALTTARDLRWYMIGELVICGCFFVCTLLYFPSAPPGPPSRSALVSRQVVVEGARRLSKKRHFWLPVLAYSIGVGFYGAWGSMLGPNLEHVLPKDEAQNEASWLGFWGSWSGCVGGIGISMVADRVQQRAQGRATGLLKNLCIGLMSLGAASFLAFASMCAGLIPSPKWALYLLCCTCGFSVNGTIPLFYELAVETAYPVAEGLTTCVLTVGNNVVALLFLFAPMVPGLGTSWMNWSVCGATVVAVGLLLPFPSRLERLAYDLAAEPATASAA
eukprot:TRINITY_DN6180_c0_g1_i1.p1 TRINITY_DN6180_c0_g1~~TRINITY_DN6180_c0_g1_i1.p1  ORF type:complete len:506 (+),score=85.75 TRINITY_DN6180_c0_g1_i1:56-1519(+)